MSRENRNRWEERYRDGDWVDVSVPAAIVADAAPWLRPPGRVLDLACGAGRNALYLAEMGFRVVAVDLSWAGLQRLARRSRARALPVSPVHGDLERFQVAEEAFDVVVNTHFLLRSLFPLIRGALKPGGCLLFETFTVDEIDVLGGEIRREFALERGELLRAFQGFEILLYEEGIFPRREGERGLVRMVGRKPE